jgi:hypothetical protein
VWFRNRAIPLNVCVLCAAGFAMMRMMNHHRKMEGFGVTGKKSVLFVCFCIEMIILPRQARDKHRENSKTECGDFLQAAGRTV